MRTQTRKVFMHHMLNLPVVQVPYIMTIMHTEKTNRTGISWSEAPVSVTFLRDRKEGGPVNDRFSRST
jgi:hypothetical protein